MRRRAILPLPAGEGRGEGEAFIETLLPNLREGEMRLCWSFGLSHLTEHLPCLQRMSREKFLRCHAPSAFALQN